jgi:hypothetical protein
MLNPHKRFVGKLYGRGIFESLREYEYSIEMDL